MKVEFLEAAQTELDQAFEWYETQKKELGVQFLNEFNSAVRRITIYPESYILIDRK
jgi:plasmid stabilization system protein ParE